jgi:hypothetical protein
MESFDLEYNSARENLVIPEYGRNVQKLIDYAKTIEDPKYRQAFVEKIVDLMQQMHPQARNMDDYREKLWKHVYRIADYDLDVTPTDGSPIKKSEVEKRPEMIDYPEFEAKYRHYGHNVQRLIKKALSMEPGPKKDGFVAVIGSYMKLAYRTWNKEHYVSDDIIKSDLESLSNGKLALKDSVSIDNLSHSNRRRKRPPSSNGHKGRGRGRKRK